MVARLSTFAADVRSVVLTGLSLVTTGAIAATDTVLAALGKLEATKAPLAAPALTGTATAVNLTVSGTTLLATATGLTAAGTTQGTGLVLTKHINVITTTASGTGVVLPNLGVGAEIVVFNRGANTLNIFPPTSGIINALAANAAITLATVTTMRFTQTAATPQYYTG